MEKLIKHLQKSLSIMMLLAYSIVLLTPMIALAEDDDDDAATDESAQSTTTETVSIPEREGEPAEILSEICTYANEEDVDTQLANHFTDDGKDHESLCGVEVNPVTNYIEKGDCSAAGKVITELSEGFAGNSHTGEAVRVGENSVVNLYKGACCFKESTDGNSCDSIRYIYTKNYSSCEENAIQCEKVQWIIGESGVGIIKVFVKLIYVWGAGVAGFIAVVVIVVSGIQISISGISGDISSAKNRIMQSIAGLVLIFLSGIILYVVNPTFFS